MSSVQYPFIDIAVHERIRAPFAAGKALVLFSADMSEVVWANGRGARLFGRASIYDLIDQGPNRNDLTFRQALVTARGLPASGETRSFVIRMSEGFARVAVTATCERIRLPNGDDGILLAAPTGAASPDRVDCARQMLEGFDDPQTHIAVLDGEGQVISATSGFAALNLTPQTARMVVTIAANDRDRLVKRPLPTAVGYLPGAVARMSEDPALNLLFLVQPEAGAPEAAELATEDKVTPSVPASIASAADFQAVLTAVAQIDELEDEAEEEAPFADDAPTQETDATAAASEFASEADPVALADEIEALPETGEAEPSSEPQETQADTAGEIVEEVEETTKATTGAISGNPTNVSEVAPLRGETFRPDMRATRFVWKIDAEGRFREVSPELAAAVGPHAAEVVGLAFTDVAALFNLDPEGKIVDLLNRRDTWSGKTIRWPIEGTTLAVPIDLAALPTYTRNREFDGFRGFGIIRMTDLQEDPLSTGLSLSPSVEGAPSSDAKTPDELDATEEASVDGLAEGIDAAHAVTEDAAAEAPHDDAIAEAGSESDANADPEPALPETEEETAEVAYPPFHLPEDEGSEAGETPEPLATDAVAADADETAPEEETFGTEEAATAADDLPTDNDVSATEHEAGTELEAEPSAPQEDLAEDLIQEPADGDDETSPIPPPVVEKPVLRIVETPGLRYSDKVLRFEERRNPQQDRLSTAEQANFKEIARRLEAFRSESSAASAQKSDNPAEGDASPIPDAHPSVEAGADTIPAELQTVGEDDAAASPVQDAVATEGVAEDESAAAPPTETQPLDATGEDAGPTPVEAGNDERPVSEEEEVEPAISIEEAYAQAIPLRPRPELSADIIDQMPVALLVHSGDRLIHANPEFLRLTGYETLSALEDVGGLDALLQRRDLEDKETEAGGMQLVRADDAVLAVSARLQSVRWEKASALVLALMPVADHAPAPVAPVPDPAEEAEKQRQADERSRLKIEVDELRAILDTATDGVVIIGADGEIRSMNRAASALFNYDNDETRGKPFVMLFAHESQKSALDYLAGLSGNGVASLLNDGREVIGREASGGFVPLFMTIGHLTSSNGYCAVIRDITQWKRTEEELRSAKRAAETASAHKSEFLAHVSHEIRTPLNAIIGFADMMATERLGPVGHTRYIEYANDIGRSGRHVLDIVNDLLDISKIEAGEMDLDFASVGLNETVAEAVSLVQPQANSQRVIIRTALSQAVPPVVADLRSVKQIVLNILSNAIRFTPSGGQIVVSTAYEANGSVVLRVRDTGIGMTRAELDLAMKPFRQVAGASRKRGDGTGLGLPLTKAMVDANRANFSIHSAPNEGTLVEVTFPSPRVLAN